MTTNDTNDDTEPEYEPHTINIQGDITAFVETNTSEEATEEFWDQANDNTEIDVELFTGLSLSVSIDKESLTAEEERDQYAVEADVDVSTTLTAIDSEDAIEQFEDGISNSYYVDMELSDELDATLYMDSSTISATA